eukprot:CAMPEP_0118831002 /NCGR_PEP_ID=MMETSP1162-20130426/28845_1 /TAXON_ID=33656 /ORGANISM="Phaeocystis Sp, Strain CCMP2710" /LENGTH=846 /DNA_ID=CAMNT_0006762377 /DNA_START=39 /DNA_END=2579 /DNA_ORIENTATION=+
MAEFGNAGKAPGLEVWRIEKMVPVRVPDKEVGKFYDGDSYICLKTVQKAGSSSLSWDIYFWLGAETSRDESGVAAYKTVELDELLGGGPVQHREVQGHESEQFIQCFKTFEIRNGGVESGFNKVEKENICRLLHLKGKRTIQVKQVQCSASSLNSGDVFILDKGDDIYQWNGAECSKKEKSKALEVTLSIKDDERGGKAQLHVMDEGSELDVFWEILGGKTAIAPATSDEEGSCKSSKPCKLFVVSDASGQMLVDEVATGNLAKDMLKTEDAFIVDNETEIFVWVGKGATADERKAALSHGQDYVTKQGRPDWTRVTKILEGTEPTTFKSCFKKWQDLSTGEWEDAKMPVDFAATPRGNTAQRKESKSASELVGSMMNVFKSKPNRRSMVDDGSGKIKVWRIEDFADVEVPMEMHGQFFAGDSYIVQYTYMERNKEAYILYFWLGSKSTQDEKGAAALITKTKDDALGGAATQVRVVQGQEPSHFVRLFKGHMVVHAGGKASGFAGSEGDYYDTDGVSLFHVKGSDEDSTKAAQVDELTKNLNSGDCFVLLTPGNVHLWEGQFASESEIAVSRKIANAMKGSRALVEVKEGEEGEDFWAPLGGKGEYTKLKEAPDGSREPMLFHCSNATGTFEVEPIYDFSQADLEQDDVFLLDVFTNLYVWIGSEANETEKSMALTTAAEYAKANGYSEDVSTVIVHSGSEPGMFTCNFLGWDAEKSKAFVDPYEAKLAAAMASNPAEVAPKRMSVLKKTPTKENVTSGRSSFAAPEPEPAPAPAPAPSANYADPSSTKLSYEELKSGRADVDPAKKEQYLSDADFEKYMKSPRSEFNAMKGWKQQQIKKAAGLY